MKSRLIELLRDAKKNTKGANCDLEREHLFADHLIENGVIVPPCKVGSKVYIIAEVSKQVVEATVIGVWLYYNTVCIITDYGTIHNNSIGKTVFLTKEEAEQKLKGGVDNGFIFTT